MPSIQETNKILNNFSILDWQNWIDDILNISLAYPLSKLSEDGDIIKDIYYYLIQTNIPVENYEIAIVERIDYYSKLNSFYDRIERLIEAVNIIKLDKSSTILIKILKSEIGLQRGKYDFIASKSMQALSGIQLAKEEIVSIYEQGLFLSNSYLRDSPAFLGNFLRFVRSQMELKLFFNTFSFIIEIIYNKNLKDNKKYFIILVDQLSEAYFTEKPSFYSNLYYWMLECWYDQKDNELYQKLLVQLKEQQSDTNIRELQVVELSNESRFGNAVLFLITFLYDQENLKRLDLKNWITNLSFILEFSPRFLKELLNDKSIILNEYIAIYHSEIFLVGTKQYLSLSDGNMLLDLIKSATYRKSLSIIGENKSSSSQMQGSSMHAKRNYLKNLININTINQYCYN